MHGFLALLPAEPTETLKSESNVTSSTHTQHAESFLSSAEDEFACADVTVLIK